MSSNTNLVRLCQVDFSTKRIDFSLTGNLYVTRLREFKKTAVPQSNIIELAAFSSVDDAKALIKHLLNEQKLPFEDNDVDRIVETFGYHPGLLARVFVENITTKSSAVQWDIEILNIIKRLRQSGQLWELERKLDVLLSDKVKLNNVEMQIDKKDFVDYLEEKEVVEWSYWGILRELDKRKWTLATIIRYYLQQQNKYTRCTVAVCDKSDNIIGTGFIVKYVNAVRETNFLIITCIHVLKARLSHNEEVYEQADEVKCKPFHENLDDPLWASVITDLNQHDLSRAEGDIAVLKIEFRSDEQKEMVLNKALEMDDLSRYDVEDESTESYCCYGYLATHGHNGAFISDIRAFGDRAAHGGKIRVSRGETGMGEHPIKNAIDSGASGAAIFDSTYKEKVFGMVQEIKKDKEDSTKQHETSFIIPARIIIETINNVMEGDK